MGVLGNGDKTRGSQGTGPGHSPRGAPLYGDPTEQRTAGPEERPHEGCAELHPGSHRPRAAVVCAQR